MKKNAVKHLWPRSTNEEEYYQTSLPQECIWRKILPNIFAPEVHMRNTTKHLWPWSTNEKEYYQTSLLQNIFKIWKSLPETVTMTVLSSESFQSLPPLFLCVCSTTSICGVLAFMTLAAVPKKKKNQWRDLRPCSTLSSFKAKLKTFLFSQYFHPN